MLYGYPPLFNIMDQEITEQTVIYKLGQIESQLANIAVKMTEQSANFQADFKDIKRIQEEQDKRIKKLEDVQEGVRNWLLGGGFVITVFYTIFKVVMPCASNLHLPT